MPTPTGTSTPDDFDNSSIAAVLSLAGISTAAVTAFIEVHTTDLRPMSMAKFLSNLRSIGDDTTLVPELFSRRFRLRALELRPNDWDSEYETDLLIGLSHWFYQQEHYDNTYDWQANLDPTVFRRYANSYKRPGLASPKTRAPFTTPAPGSVAPQHPLAPTIPPRPAPTPTAPVTAPINLFGPRDSSPSIRLPLLLRSRCLPFHPNSHRLHLRTVTMMLFLPQTALTMPAVLPLPLSILLHLVRVSGATAT